jgi:hypothetical protein
MIEIRPGPYSREIVGSAGASSSGSSGLGLPSPLSVPGAKSEDDQR